MDNFSEEQILLWENFCSDIGVNPEQIPDRLQALDALIENMVEILEQVSADNGL